MASILLIKPYFRRNLAMTRNKKLTSLATKKRFLVKAPILDLIAKIGKVQIRRNLKSRPNWPLWMWAIYYLIAYDDPRYRQKKSIAHYAQQVVPFLREAKRMGLPIADDLPPDSLSRREGQVMRLYYLNSLTEEKVGESLGIAKCTARSYRRNAIAKIYKLLASFAGHRAKKQFSYTVSQ